MKNVMKFALFGLLLITLTLIPGDNAAAFPDIVNCGATGGNWHDVSSTYGYCVYTGESAYANSYCGAGVGMIDTYLYMPAKNLYELINSRCTESPNHLPYSNKTVVIGQPLDAWQGKCGVYVFEPPYRGAVQLLSISSNGVPKPAPNYANICKVSYYHEDGNEATRWGSAAWVYMNLDVTAAKYWNDGDLNIYILEGETWTECANPLFVEFGDYGRLACYSNNPTMWGIGTDLK